MVNHPAKNSVAIYSLHDPRSGELRYIGKTVLTLQKRLQTHISNAINRRVSRAHTAVWIRSLYKEDLVPDIKLVEITNEEHWIEREKFWIKTCRQTGCRLTNHTDGGEGQSGYRQSAESRQKSADSRKGFRHSEETKKRMSEIAKLRKPHTGWNHTDETKKIMSEKAKLRPINLHLSLRKEYNPQEVEKEGFDRSYEWRVKIGEANKGSSNAMAKLDDNKVRKIKQLIIEKELTFGQIAEAFGVSRTLVGMISRGQRWQHIK